MIQQTLEMKNPATMLRVAELSLFHKPEEGKLLVQQGDVPRCFVVDDLNMEITSDFFMLRNIPYVE